MIYKVEVDGKEKTVRWAVKDCSRRADNKAREEIIRGFLDDGASEVIIKGAVEEGRIELHCHTKMTKEKGLISPGELVRYAYENGYKAIAITDYENVQAFPEAYREWKRLWSEYQDECLSHEKKAIQEDFLKVIYGLEGNLLSEEGKIFKVLIYAKNEIGIRNLYRIVTASNLYYTSESKTLIPRDIIDKYREGLIVGSAGYGGEVYEAVCYGHSKSNTQSIVDSRREKNNLSKLKKIVSYYDFIEVVPFDRLDVKYLSFGCGKGSSIPMIAMSDAYYLSEKDKECWDILTSKKKEQNVRPRHLISDREEAKSYLNKCVEGKNEEHLIIPDAIFDNASIIEEQIKYISPIREGRYFPEYPDAEKALAEICERRVKDLFGARPDKEVTRRLNMELNAICENGFADIYMIWKQLVEASLDKGYPVGQRGSVGSSFVAYLCGITDINPLSSEQGGYDIRAEVFMGIDLKKEPDIDINFADEIKETIQDHVKDLPGVGETCHGGTISKFRNIKADIMVEEYYRNRSDKVPDEEIKESMVDRICGVKRGDGIHTGGIIVCPEGEDLISFSPLMISGMGKKITTMFDYHEIDDNLLKLDILGHEKYDMLHFLQENTGVMSADIPLDDEKVIKMICDPSMPIIYNLPEFGSEYVRRIITETKVNSLQGLIRISALSHGTGVWEGNQKRLVEGKIIELKDCITSRDDIMIELMSHKMDKKDAFQIMESVRKGRGINSDQKRLIKSVGMPEWYISVCEKIKYLFPKAHAVSYTIMAVRLAYYMVYYPEAYSEGLSYIS